MKQTVLLILFFVVFSFAKAQSNWELVYHHDKEGNAIEGNVNDLIEAIRNGKEIRLAWWSEPRAEYPKRKVEHLADATFLTIMSDSIVFGQIRPIYGQIPDFNEFKFTLKENLEWIIIGGTNGKTDSMTRNTVTGEIVSHNARQLPLKWYVRN